MALVGKMIAGLIGVLPVVTISIIAGLNASFFRKVTDNQNLQTQSKKLP